MEKFVLEKISPTFKVFRSYTFYVINNVLNTYLTLLVLSYN